MVKEGNYRQYFTVTPKTMEKIKLLQDKYDMTVSELVKFLVNNAIDSQERK